MSDAWFSRYCAPVLPWLFCIGFALWCTSPIWGTPHLLFMGRPETDSVVTPWFYDFVARSMWAGEDFTTLRDFDFPNPHVYVIEFPSTTEAQIAAPIAWLFDWPAQWAVTLSAAVVFNCLSVSILAYAMGLGSVGIAFSGMTAALMRPMWADMVMGRMNVLTPAFAILALAGVLMSFRRGPNGRTRSLRFRAAAFGMAYAMGCSAALIYPPFLLMLVPVGGIIGASVLWRNGWLGWLVPYVAGWLSYLTVFDHLWVMYDRASREVDCAALPCPDIYNAVPLSNLSLFEEIPELGLSFSGIQGGAWVLLPLVVFHPKWRFRALLLGLVAVCFAFLSMGPCPYENTTDKIQELWLENLKPHLNPFWCASIHLHDFGRFALIASVVLSLCSGIAVDGLFRRRMLLSKAFALMAAMGMLFTTYTPLMKEILQPTKWHAVPTNPIADFLHDKQDLNVAELPFDRSAQFLSVLQSPGALRVNPIRPNDPPRDHSDFYLWLDAVGKGKEPLVVPTEQEVANSQLDLILYDASRCRHNPNQQSACDPWVTQMLEDVLGQPKLLSFGVRYWEIDGE